MNGFLFPLNKFYWHTVPFPHCFLFFFEFFLPHSLRPLMGQPRLALALFCLPLQEGHSSSVSRFAAIPPLPASTINPARRNVVRYVLMLLPVTSIPKALATSSRDIGSPLRSTSMSRILEGVAPMRGFQIASTSSVL